MYSIVTLCPDTGEETEVRLTTEVEALRKLETLRLQGDGQALIWDEANEYFIHLPGDLED